MAVSAWRLLCGVLCAVVGVCVIVPLMVFTWIATRIDPHVCAGDPSRIWEDRW